LGFIIIQINEVTRISQIKVKIKQPSNNDLKKVVRFFWFATGIIEDDERQFLLPMDHCDMIINCTGKMEYVSNNKWTISENVAFHGLRKGPVEIIQRGYCETFGITFESWGLYPFVYGDMSLYTDEIVNLSKVNNSLYLRLSEIIEETRNELPEQIFDQLTCKVEGLFLEQFKCTDSFMIAVDVLSEFCAGKHENIKEFCYTSNINRRKLQRYFNKYIGVSPKEYMKIAQFENSTRGLMDDKNAVISDLVYDGQYFDQSHFTKSFKELSSYTPFKFRKEQPGLKSKLKFGD